MCIELRKATLCLAAIVATTPVATYANEASAVDRCVEIFVKEVVPGDLKASIRREDIHSAVRPMTATRSKVMLIARGKKDSKLFGRASCVIDRNGSIVGLYLYESNTGPNGNARPKVLARNVDINSDVLTARASDTKPF